jgi:hypothetical protein
MFSFAGPPHNMTAPSPHSRANSSGMSVFPFHFTTGLSIYKWNKKFNLLLVNYKDFSNLNGMPMQFIVTSHKTKRVVEFEYIRRTTPEFPLHLVNYVQPPEFFRHPNGWIYRPSSNHDDLPEIRLYVADDSVDKGLRV